MNGLRKPRQARPVGNPLVLFSMAVVRVSRLNEDEIAETMRPIRICARYLREGVATEDQFVVFRTAMRMAQAIEQKKLFRGLGGHIDAVLCACSAIHDRAMASGTWKPVQLNLAELDAINDMVDLHDVQLRQVTTGELEDLARKLIATATAKGETPIQTRLEDIGVYGYATN